MTIKLEDRTAGTVTVAVLGAGAWLVLRMEGELPAITFPKEVRALGKSTAWGFVAADQKSGLRQVRAWVRQGEKSTPLFSEDYPGRGTNRREVNLTLDPKALGLADGAATLIVAAQDHSLKNFKGNSVFREVPVTIDTEAPRLDILSTQYNVNRGGVGVVAYRLSEPAALTGVTVGDRFFPGYPEAAGGAGAHVAFFAIPHDAPAAPAFSLSAGDAAGNEVRRAFAVRLLEKVFPADTIDISDRFLGAKIPEFRAADPSLPADPVAAFLVVNRDWRARDHQRIREACATSSPARLWSGPFLQMPNTKNMAGWAQARTYKHNGQVIDHQTHLGLDLASTAGAPVPAANAGTVGVLRRSRHLRPGGDPRPRPGGLLAVRAPEQPRRQAGRAGGAGRGGRRERPDRDGRRRPPALFDAGERHVRQPGGVARRPLDRGQRREQARAVRAGAVTVR